MMNKTLLALALCSMSMAHAEDRALLIGIGAFSAKAVDTRPHELYGTAA